MRFGRVDKSDAELNPSYHDPIYTICRDCGCDGDLRWGLCFACAMTTSQCDDKKCPEVERLRNGTYKSGAD